MKLSNCGSVTKQKRIQQVARQVAFLEREEFYAHQDQYRRFAQSVGEYLSRLFIDDFMGAPSQTGRLGSVARSIQEDRAELKELAKQFILENVDWPQQMVDRFIASLSQRMEDQESLAMFLEEQPHIQNLARSRIPVEEITTRTEYDSMIQYYRTPRKVMPLWVESYARLALSCFPSLHKDEKKVRAFIQSTPLFKEEYRHVNEAYQRVNLVK